MPARTVTFDERPAAVAAWAALFVSCPNSTGGGALSDAWRQRAAATREVAATAAVVLFLFP